MKYQEVREGEKYPQGFFQSIEAESGQVYARGFFWYPHWRFGLKIEWFPKWRFRYFLDRQKLKKLKLRMNFSTGAYVDVHTGFPITQRYMDEVGMRP